VACEGVFPLVHVVAEGGNDKITMDLLVNEFKMNAEVYGDAGDDELRATPDNRDVAQPTTYMEGVAVTTRSSAATASTSCSAVTATTPCSPSQGRTRCAVRAATTP